MTAPTPSLPEAAAAHHPSVQDVVQYLQSSHLPPELQAVAQPFEDAAAHVLTAVHQSSPELTVAMRKLLEGKDAAVRAAGSLFGLIHNPVNQ